MPISLLLVLKPCLVLLSYPSIFVAPFGLCFLLFFLHSLFISLIISRGSLWKVQLLGYFPIEEMRDRLVLCRRQYLAEAFDSLLFFKLVVAYGMWWYMAELWDMLSMLFVWENCTTQTKSLLSYTVRGIKHRNWNNFSTWFFKKNKKPVAALNR